MHDKISDPLTLALLADEVYQSRVSSTINHVSSASVLGDEYPVLAIRAPSSHAQCSPTPGPASAVLHLLLPPTTMMTLLPFAGITILMDTWPRSAESHVPSKETSCSAGGPASQFYELLP